MNSFRQPSSIGDSVARDLEFRIQNLFAEDVDFPSGIAASEFTSRPVTYDESIIDLGFGLPDPKLFHLDALRRASDEAIRTEGPRALQYGGGAGMMRLPEWVRLVQTRRRNIPCNPGDLLLTHGSSQGMDLLGRLFLNPGDEVWFERPTYFGAIKIFGLHGAKMRDFPMDESGLVTDVVASELKKRQKAALPMPKLLYVMPNYQNPTGRTMTLSRRTELVNLAKTYRFAIVEDDAYGDLRFSGNPLPTLRQLCPSHVFYLSTLSKTVAPGFRMGWLIGPEEAVTKLRELKAEGANGGFVQEILSVFLASMDYDAHISHLQNYYHRRRDAMVSFLERDFPPEVGWTTPDGGFFVWLTLPSWAPLNKVMDLRRSAGVSFIPGTAFYLGEGSQNHVRLSFSLYPPELIVEGMRRLRDLIESLRP
ncbi:MAG: PLP-dependent aminotransferase family protein [Sulfobacillus benefaciens]|uniref:PLP-dependent aminotransferase family protein n=1 Tax=Sulfobacillus benefaciens TaxID=453960 RepID=A0A2T2WVR7_9FIRM|nr:MAG: PLP-dependent aminotransferase family protein [Sulfobacillus benefaciens]